MKLRRIATAPYQNKAVRHRTLYLSALFWVVVSIAIIAVAFGGVYLAAEAYAAGKIPDAAIPGLSILFTWVPVVLVLICMSGAYVAIVRAVAHRIRGGSIDGR